MYRCVLLISVIVYQLRHICVSSVIQLSTFRVVGVVICTQFCYTIFILVYAYLELRNIHYVRRNWGHSFGVVTKLRPGWLGILVQYPTAAGDISVLQGIRPVSEAHPRMQEAVSPGTDGNHLSCHMLRGRMHGAIPYYRVCLNGEVLYWTQGQICLFFFTFLRHFMSVFSPYTYLGVIELNHDCILPHSSHLNVH